MQKHVNLVDLVKSFPTNIYLQNLASMQKRTSPIKFAHLAEKSENGSTSNLSTKVAPAAAAPDPTGPALDPGRPISPEEDPLAESDEDKSQSEIPKDDKPIGDDKELALLKKYTPKPGVARTENGPGMLTWLFGDYFARVSAEIAGIFR